MSELNTVQISLEDYNRLQEDAANYELIRSGEVKTFAIMHLSDGSKYKRIITTDEAVIEINKNCEERISRATFWRKEEIDSLKEEIERLQNQKRSRSWF